jgi:hypothetical protein
MMGITYDKETRTKAKNQEKDLFSCGVKELKGQGRAEMCAPMSWKMGEALFWFCIRVNQGHTPAEAFALVKWPGGRERELKEDRP